MKNIILPKPLTFKVRGVTLYPHRVAYNTSTLQGKFWRDILPVVVQLFPEYLQKILEKGETIDGRKEGIYFNLEIANEESRRRLHYYERHGVWRFWNTKDQELETVVNFLLDNGILEGQANLLPYQSKAIEICNFVYSPDKTRKTRIQLDDNSYFWLV